MKIAGNNANLDPAALQRLERAAADGTRQAHGAKAGSADRVDVSPDAALANEAAKAASDVPEVRQDLVDRMRALLDAGQLGSDADALADSLIDSLLGQQ
jgi:flagellar biosynthesis anti-sigma factor FlgM